MVASSIFGLLKYLYFLFAMVVLCKKLNIKVSVIFRKFDVGKVCQESKKKENPT